MQCGVVVDKRLAKLSGRWYRVSSRIGSTVFLFLC